MHIFNIPVDSHEVKEFRELCSEYETNPSRQLSNYIKRCLREQKIQEGK